MHEKDSGGQVFDADVALKAVRAEADQLDLISRSGRPAASVSPHDTEELPSPPIPEAVDDDDVLETPDDPRIPPDQTYFKIGEVADIVGVKPYVLRFWENEFPWVKPEKTSSRQRRYRRQDVAVLLQIRRLRYDEQLTVARARELIREARRRGSPHKRPTSLVAGALPALPAGVTLTDHRQLAKDLDEMQEILLGLLEAVED